MSDLSQEVSWCGEEGCGLAKAIGGMPGTNIKIARDENECESQRLRNGLGSTIASKGWAIEGEGGATCAMHWGADQITKRIDLCINDRQYLLKLSRYKPKYDNPYCDQPPTVFLPLIGSREQSYSHHQSFFRPIISYLIPEHSLDVSC